MEKNDNLTQLHKKLVKDGYDMPSLDQFRKDMQDENNLREMHTTLSKDGYDMPSLDQFKADMGYGSANPVDQAKAGADVTKQENADDDGESWFGDVNEIIEQARKTGDEVKANGQRPGEIRPLTAEQAQAARRQASFEVGGELTDDDIKQIMRSNQKFKNRYTKGNVYGYYSPAYKEGLVKADNVLYPRMEAARRRIDSLSVEEPDFKSMSEGDLVKMRNELVEKYRGVDPGDSEEVQRDALLLQGIDQSIIAKRMGYADYKEMNSNAGKRDMALLGGTMKPELLEKYRNKTNPGDNPLYTDGWKVLNDILEKDGGVRDTDDYIIDLLKQPGMEDKFYAWALARADKSNKPVAEVVDDAIDDFRMSMYKGVNYWELPDAKGAVLEGVKNELSGELDDLKKMEEDARKYDYIDQEPSPTGMEFINVTRNDYTPLLKTAEHMYQEAYDLVNEAIIDRKDANNGSSFIEGSVRGLKNSLTNPDTWLFGIGGAIDASRLYDVAQKVEKKQELNQYEQKLMDALALKLTVVELTKEYIGHGYKAGQMTGDAVPFILEMLNPIAKGAGIAAKGASQGAKSAIKAAANWAIKRFAGNLPKAVARLAEKMGLKTAMRGIAKFAEKSAVKGVVNTAGKVVDEAVKIGTTAGTMSATTGSARIYGDMRARQMGEGQVGRDPNTGKYIITGFANRKSAGRALFEATANQGIEYASEMVGEFFKPFAKFVGKLTGKGARKVGLGDLLDAVNNLKGGSYYKILQDFRKNVHYDGSFGEYMEEVVGNIANAILVGDQNFSLHDKEGNFSLHEENSVFNIDDNIDTYIGVKYMSSLFGAANVIGYRTPKYRQRQMVETLETLGQRVFGKHPKEWEVLRQAVAGGNGDEVQSVLKDIIVSKDYTRTERQAALNYAGEAFKLKGMEMGDVKTAKDATEQRLEELYGEGYNLSDLRAINEAKGSYEISRKAMEKVLPPELMGMLEDDPKAVLEWMRENPEWSDEQKAAGIEFVNNTARYNGMLDREKDNVESDVKASNDAIDAKVNGTEQGGDGKIHPVTLRNEETVYVTNGNVATDSDGKIDTDNSSNELVVVTEDGEVKMIPASDVVSVGEVMEPDVVKQEAENSIRQAAQDLTDSEDTETVPQGEGIVVTGTNEANVPHDETGNPVFKINDTFVLEVDGERIPGQVTREVDDNGKIEVYTDKPVDGKKMHEYTPEEFAQMVKDYHPANSVKAPVQKGLPKNGNNVTGTQEPVAEGQAPTQLTEEDHRRIIEEEQNWLDEHQGADPAEREEHRQRKWASERALGLRDENNEQGPIAQQPDKGQGNEEQADNAQFTIQNAQSDGASEEIVSDLNAPMPTKEVNGKQRVDYNRATPERAAHHIYNEKGYTQEEADTLVANTIAAKQKAAEEKAKALEEAKAEVEKAEAMRPTTPLTEETEDEYNAEKAQIEQRRSEAQAKAQQAAQELSQAQQELGHWQNIQAARAQMQSGDNAQSSMDNAQSTMHNAQSDSGNGQSTAAEQQGTMSSEQPVGNEEQTPRMSTASEQAPTQQSEQSPNSKREGEAAGQRMKERIAKLSEQIRAKVEKIAEACAIPSHIIESEEDLDKYPKYIRDEVRKAIKAGKRVRGFYDPKSGHMFFYLPGLASEKDVDETYAHETVAHGGLRELLRDRKTGSTAAFDELCDKVWNLMSVRDQARYLDYVGVKSLKDVTQENKRAAADEYMAHLSDGQQKSSTGSVKKVLRAIADAIKNFFKKRGINLNIKSDEDIMALLEHSRNYLSNVDKAAIMQWVSDSLDDSEDGKLRMSTVSIFEGAGFEAQRIDENGKSVPLTDAEGNMVVKMRGKEFSAKNPIKASDLNVKEGEETSVLQMLVNDAKKVNNLSEKRAKKIYQNYADILNMYLRMGSAEMGGPEAVERNWEWLGETVYRTIAANGDAQYSYSMDIIKVCKKNEAVIKAISAHQLLSGRGATPSEIVEIYRKTYTEGFQVPCPVCYVFTRYIRNGKYASAAIRGMEAYGEHLPGGNKEWTVKQWLDELDRLNRLTNSKYEPKGKETDEQKEARVKEAKRYENALADANEITVVYEKRINALSYELTHGVSKEREKEIMDEIKVMDARYQGAIDVISFQALTNWIKTFAIEEKSKKWKLRDDAKKPEDMNDFRANALDLRLTANTMVNYPAIQRLRKSGGSAAGKEITFASNNELGEVVSGLGRNVDKSGVNARRAINRMKRLGELKAEAGKIATKTGSYQDVKLKQGDVVYADLPYEGTDTRGYGNGSAFDKAAFNEWAQKQNVPVFVSETTMPEGWTEIDAFDIKAMKGKRTEKLWVQDKFAGEYETSSRNTEQEADGGLRFSTSEEIEELNDIFNKQLQQQIEGKLPQGHVYEMGTPSVYLLSTGIPYLPIRLQASVLNRKTNDPAHRYSLSEVHDLVKLIQKPIAIFKYGDEKKAQNLMVGISQDVDEGRQFLVGLALNPSVNGKELEINSVRNVFPKNFHDWVHWINQGKLLRVDGKKEIQAIIDALRINPVDYIIDDDLDNATNIVKDFVNPSIEKEKNEETTGKGGVMMSTIDSDYMSAVEAGDTKKAEQMVKEAAKAALPDTKVVGKDGEPLVVWHGTLGNFNTFRRTNDIGFHFGTKGTARARVGRKGKVMPVYLDIKNPIRIEQDFGSWDADYMLGDYLVENGIISQDELNKVLYSEKGYKLNTQVENKALRDLLLSKGYDGIIYNNWYEANNKLSYIVFRPNQIKSADPVTYDDNGNVIPLSERFDFGKDDIRFREAVEEGGELKIIQDKKTDTRMAADYQTGERRPVVEDASTWRIEGMPGEYGSREEAIDAFREYAQGSIWDISEDGERIEVLGRGDRMAEMTGRTGKKEQERRERWAQERAERAREVIDEQCERLGVQVHYVDDMSTEEREGLSAKQRRAKGWYDTRTGEVWINMGNHNSYNDIMATFLHEVVAHKGLRKLFGKDFDTFLDNVYANAEIGIRNEIARMAARNGWDFREATEEYLARLAESSELDNPDKRALLSRVKRAFMALLNKVGLRGLSLSDNDLRYVLWSSWHNMEEQGALGAAEDVVMREKLGIFNAQSTMHNAQSMQNSQFTMQNGSEAAEAQESGMRFSTVPIDRAIARDYYEHIMQSGRWQWLESMQDSMLSLKKLMQGVMGDAWKTIDDVPENENAYMAENLLSSMTAAQQQAYYSEFIKPLLKEVSRLCKGRGREKKRQELTDYLLAKHGLERNKVLADRDAQETAAAGGDYQDAYDANRERDYSGLTALTGETDVHAAEAAAQQMVDEYEAAHDTTALWDMIRAATQTALDKQYKSGLMSHETYQKVSNMFEYYVPLRGWEETTSDQVYGYLNGKGAAGGSIAKRAKGRSSKADDPIATIAKMGDDAIRQGNRNLMKQRFLNFVLNHPSDLVSVSELWLKYNDVTGEWEPVFADIPADATAEEVEQIVEQFEHDMEQLAQQEPDKYKHGRDAANIPYRVVPGNEREHQVLVKRGGNTFVLTINGNPRAAQALNGLTNPDVEMKGAWGSIIKGSEWVNRTLSALYTTLSPAFIVSNFARDTIYSNTMAWIKESPNYAARFNLNYLRLNPYKIRKLLGKWEKGTLDESKPVEKYFKEFMLHGGETGFAIVQDMETYKKKLAKELKGMNSRNYMKKGWNVLAAQYELLGRSIENCARFAAYMTSRQMGRMADRSAFDAKEISVNFNKKGSGGKLLGQTGQTNLGNTGAFVSGLARSLYTFWNAGVQGMANAGRAVKRRPVKATLVGIGPLYTLGFLQPVLAAMMCGGDGDDENSYYNLPEYVRRSNICIYIGGKWLTIPLPIEFRAIYGLGELTYGVISGNERYSNEDLAMNIGSQVSQLLPIDMLEGGGGFHPFIPTLFKPIVEAQQNKSWSGLPIYRADRFAEDEYKPQYTKAYKNANEWIVAGAEWLNAATGGTEKTKGWIDINPAKIEYMLKGYLGGIYTTIDEFRRAGETAFGDREFEWRNIPLANRIIKQGDERTEYRKLREEYFKYKKEYNKTKYEMKVFQESDNTDLFDYAKKLSDLNYSKEYGRYLIFEKYAGTLKDLMKKRKDITDKNELAENEAKELKVMRMLVDEMHAYEDGKLTMARPKLEQKDKTKDPNYIYDSLSDSQDKNEDSLLKDAEARAKREGNIGKVKFIAKARKRIGKMKKALVHGNAESIMQGIRNFRSAIVRNLTNTTPEQDAWDNYVESLPEDYDDDLYQDEMPEDEEEEEYEEE